MRRVLMLVAILSIVSLAYAQDAPVLTGTEYDLGLDCPVAQYLSPDGATLYVVLEGCFSGEYSLVSFNVADGSLIPASGNYSDDLDPLGKGYVDGRTNPMIAGPDGQFILRYVDNETYALRRLEFFANGAPLSTRDGEETALTETLLGYTDYPETVVYSPDHVYAVAVGSTELTALDLATGDYLFSLPVEEESYNAYTAFSPDSSTLYVAVLDDYEDVENNNATVFMYSMPGGEPAGSFASPSFIVWVSPDGRYAAAETGSSDGETSELFVVDIASGAVSAPFSLYEPSHKLTNCTNDGRDMSDVDFTVSGKLYMTDLNWLPDSSGFVLTRSYHGEGAFGGTPCAFNTSRLNVVTVSMGQ